MNRADFRELTLTRINDARVLLRSRRYSGAYYVCGYAVECALKACIAKKTRRFEFPDLNFVRSIYTHEIPKLVKAADLSTELEQEQRNDPQFQVLWSVVLLWSEESRYEKHSRREANDLYEAIVNPGHGVLRWIRRYW